MPLQKHELFTRSKCPNCLPGDTHRGALGAPSSGTAARPRRGIQINLGRGSRSSCRVPGGPFRAAERAAVSSLRAPLSAGTRVKSHPARGEQSHGAGESQASGGRSSGLPLWPSDTRGTPGLPRAVTMHVWTLVNPRGWFPGGRGGPGAAREAARQGWRPECLLRVVLPPGGDRAPPLTGSEQPSPGERNRVPRAPGPKRPSPPPAAPPPCPGRSKQETQDLTWSDPDFWPGFPLSR